MAKLGRGQGRFTLALVIALGSCLVLTGAARADSLTGGKANYYHDGSHGTLDLGGGTTWVLTWWDLDLTGFTGALNLVYGDDGSGSGWENFAIQIHAHHTGAGGHLLQAYDKWWGGPISSHGLNPGDGTSPFDVRVFLTQNLDDTWHIEPYLRLDGGSWTPFWDGPFDSADAFGLTASTLMVEFDPSGSGTVIYEAPTAASETLTGGTAKYFHDGSHGILDLSDGEVHVLTWWDLDLNDYTGALNLVYGDDGSGSGWENFPLQIHAHHTGFGGHLLQAYDKWWGGPISSHGLNPDDGTEPFDVRVFLQQNLDDTWHIEPYVRLSGGSWTPFFDGLFDSAEAFDLTASTLMVQFDGSGSGTVHYAPPTAGGEVVCDPDPLILNVASLPGDPHGQIAVEYLGGGSGAVYGYSISFSWDGAVASTIPTDVAEGTLLSNLGSTFFHARTTGTNEITVDCSLLGAIDGSSGPGTLFTIGFDAEAFGTSALNLTLLEFRDNANNPLSGFYEDDGEIQVDITNPSVTNVAIENLTLGHTDEYAKNTDNLELTATVTDDHTLTKADIVADLSTLLTVGGGSAVPAQSYASPLATWTLPLANVSLTADGLKTVTVTATDGLGNSAFSMEPKHEGLIMSWDDPSTTDTNFYGVLIRYDDWDDYPYYDDPPPLYPPDETGGEGDLYDEPGLVMYWEASKTDRDISYASAFVYDYCLNYSPVDAGGQDRATNYWLGDVAGPMGQWGSDPGFDYNGLVNDADFDKLAGTYAASSPVIPDAECDVGPSDDHSRVGVPEPDDFIGFEDLMMFAMNYGVVAPRVVPFLPDEATKALSLELAELGSADGVLEVALRLEGNASEVKGLSTVLSYDATDLEFVSARLSDDMSSPLAPVFFWHGSDDESVQVDLAVLGTDVTVGGSGEVAVMTFRALSDEYALEFESATVRSGDNEDLVAGFEGIESKPEVPAAFRLVGNLPNPFNPVTKIAYEMPREADVAIRIYDVSGRLVRTLVDQRIEPGRHEAVWNGRNDTGEPVGSGVYFCTMDAEGFHGSHKMTLLK